MVDCSRIFFGRKKPCEGRGKKEEGSSATSNVRDITDVTDVSPSEEGRGKKASEGRGKKEEGRRKREDTRRHPKLEARS
ncbi:hypothetical protein [Microcoleus sp. B4-D4]|uniref:hypothetical protein n=1 Tax=Microcoleus sp. B4-D4 TaxID=2818667 RepID=UPI002FCFD0EC